MFVFHFGVNTQGDKQGTLHSVLQIPVAHCGHTQPFRHSPNFQQTYNKSNKHTDPEYRLQWDTQVPCRLWFLHVKHCSGPGPQHPASEHSGSHTWPSSSVYMNTDMQNKGLFVYKLTMDNIIITYICEKSSMHS